MKMNQSALIFLCMLSGCLAPLSRANSAQPTVGNDLHLNCDHLQCDCVQHEGKPIANCWKQNLTDVPSGLPSRIIDLTMDFNHLSTTLNEKNHFKQKQLTHLVTISLKHCEISELHFDTFSGLAQLETIYLSENELYDEPPQLNYTAMKQLKTLDLSRNKIERIMSSLFLGAASLKKLNLANNAIISISSIAFVGLTNLVDLKLQGNRLMSFYKLPHPFKPLHNLQRLSLESNPWICDCDMRGFVENYFKVSRLGHSPICQEPARFRGKTWDQLDADDFACGPSFESASPQKITVLVGTPLTITCTVYSDPQPTVQWTFEKTSRFGNSRKKSPLPDGIRQHMTNYHRSYTSNYLLEIAEANETFEGQYACILENNADKIFRTFQVNIVHPPNPAPQPDRSNVFQVGTLSDAGDLWLIIVVVSATIFIICLLVLVVWCYRRKVAKRGISKFSSVNGYGYQVIEGANPAAVAVTDKTNRVDAQGSWLYAPNDQNLCLQREQKALLFDEPVQSMPQDDSGYLEQTMDSAFQSSPRILTLQRCHNGYPDSCARSSLDQGIYIDRYINGKAPLAQQERPDDMKMPLRETAL